MALRKCCVGGCEASNETHRLFRFPKNDNLSKLWLSFIGPTNPVLITLSKEQLGRSRVCAKHFDKYQFDNEGRRLRYSYPCLITDIEVAHGIPLVAAGRDCLSDHNYSKTTNDDGALSTEASIPITQHGKAWNVLFEHAYCKSQDETNASGMSVEINNPGMHINNDELELQSITKQNTIRRQKALPTLAKKNESFLKYVRRFTKENPDNSASQRLTKAQNLVYNEKLFDKFNLLNKQAQTFILMQLRQADKKKMSRRFSLNEKLMALLLMKQSPKGYKLLETMFALPNKRTLNRLSSKITIKPGFNSQIFQYIKNKVKYWDTKQKLCTLVFDEVSLTPHLTFNENMDIIYGFVDVGMEKKLKFCDHALVFMLRGVCSPWRQCVAYYFSEGTVPAASLEKILKELIIKVVETGLVPLGLICDQGSTFRTALASLRESTVRTRSIQGLKDDGSTCISDYDLSIFFDTPHLLKGIRNNFLTKDILWGGKTATWKDIIFIYDLDSKLGHTRALPKLSAHHVDPKKIKKMKVSIAAQVLSARTAAMLKYTNALNNLHKREEEGSMGTTAEVVEFFDELFDSVNGYPGGIQKGKLRKAVKKNSQHIPFWTNAIKKLKNINFVDSNSKFAISAGKPRLVTVPSLRGWITTLESFIRVSKLLFEKYQVEYYYPRFINQDPLENFFGRIRALNYRNVNPDANTFIYAYKSLIITNILSPHSKFSNCEVDNGDTLLDVSFLFEDDNSNKENETENYTECSLPCTSQKNKEIPLVDQAVLEKIKVQCSAYTAGYICRKISKSINCKCCIKTYTSSTKTKIHNFIKYREYKYLKNSNLAYPSEHFLILYRKASEIIHNYLNLYGYKEKVGTNIKKHLKNNITEGLSLLGCAKHRENINVIFVNVILRLQVHNWCNIINKILNGAINEKYVSKMGDPQKLALKKYKSFRLRKKINK